MSIEYSVRHRRNPTKSNEKDWQLSADQWEVTINAQTFSYFSGIGHIQTRNKSDESTFNRLKYSNLTDYELKQIIELSVPVKPELDAVLYSLLLDSEAAQMTFEDWCSTFSYDTDSREALKMYLLSQENAAKLIKAGINIKQERERLADY